MVSTQFLLVVAMVVVAMAMVTKATTVTVDTSKVIHTTDDHYISFTIDSGFFKDPNRWRNFNYTSRKLSTLLAVFSPAILRVGGSSADWTVFNVNKKAVSASKLTLPSSVQVMSEQDWYNLNWLVRGTGLRLLFCLNLQQRFGENWDPTTTAELMDFSTKLEIGEHVDFELGNEPNAYTKLVTNGLVPIDPDQIARDYVELRALTRQYPWFNRENRIVGPDVVHTDPDTIGGKIIRSVAEIAGKDIDAITFHQYYIRGDTAKVDDFLNPGFLADHYLPQEIRNVRDIIKNTSNPDLPYWLGETSDAWHGGAPGISDKFVSGFLWMDKLGLAASMGVGVVMRQTFWGGNYGLIGQDLNPNPDYWLSWLFFRLVGHKVLAVEPDPKQLVTTRVYAHCTNLRYTIPEPYPAGSVTVFGLNMADNVTETIQLGNDLQNQDVDEYLMQPGDDKGMLSRTVKVNGQLLTIEGETGLPFVIKPKKTNSAAGLQLPPRTFGFFVLPKANVDVCK